MIRIAGKRLESLLPRGAAATVMGIVLAIAFAGPSSWAQSYTFDSDYLAIVSQAPGIPENSVYAGFENNESVSLYNGNLMISHPSSPAYPLDGGGTLQLVRTYNSKEARLDSVHVNENWNPFSPIYRNQFHGRSWVGVGWTMHLGRLFRKAAPSPPHPDGYPGPRRVFFEDANGTEHMIAPFQTAAHPQFRVEFVNEETQTVVVCSDPSMPYCGEGSDCCDGGASGGICDLCTCDCWEEEEFVDVAHYMLTYPDGTQYHLEKIVPEQTGPKNWIDNYDRAGWYTTQIIDVHGNVSVEVEYYRDENPSYPEAIKSVAVRRSGEADPVTVIETTVWDTGDFKDGCLEDLTALGAGGEWVTSTFSYDSRNTDLPVLTQVELPEVDQQQTGTIQYDYPTDEWWPNNLSVSRVHYPLGAVSEYTYGPYRSGRRPWPGPEALCDRPGGCPFWPIRMTRGVEKRTLYPADLGENEPRYTWSWERDFFADDCIDPPSAWYNTFRMTTPDGTATVSQFDGHPCGGVYTNGLDGWEAQRVVFDAADAPVRTEQMTYDFTGTSMLDLNNIVALEVMLEQSDVTYEDDSGRQMHTFHHQRDDYNHWRLTRQTGDYFKVGDNRLTYTNYESPLDSCRRDNHVLTAYDFSFVQQGDQRSDRMFVFNCEGQIAEARGLRDISQVTGTCERPAGDDWDSWDVQACAPVQQPSSDVVHSLSYGSDATLDSIVYSGGDGYSDASLNPQTYGIDFVWSHGRGVAAKNSNLPYFARDLTADAAGFITASYDPNGRMTQFGYDELGRVTLIKPGGLEHPTRVVHEGLSSTKVIRSDGAEEQFQAGNDNQVFSELHFDGLGRLNMREKAVPGHADLAVQLVRYDPMGRVVFESEWMTESELNAAATEVWSDNVVAPDGPYTVEVPLKDGRPWGTVTFYGTPDPSGSGDPLVASPDPLGRVRRIEKADGSVVEKNYFGPHEEVTVKNVGLAAGSADVTTRYYYDGLGRLALVDVPPLSENTADPVVGADAVYDYDVNGNLIRVRLVDRLPTSPFDSWKADGISGGQVRTFTFDALGQLRQSVHPENGTTYFDAYDAWGNLLESRDALGQERGYIHRSVFEIGGRLEEAQKVTDAASNRVGADGAFESGLQGWQTGTVSNDTFTAVDPGSSPWAVASYGSLSCISAPPGSGNDHALKLGSSCDYSSVSAGKNAIRYPLTNVGLDDQLTFKYWRQVREGSGGLDRVAAYVVLGSSDSTAGRRILVDKDQDHLSFARWRQTDAMRLSDMFTDSEWGTGTQNLYLYVEFAKGDTEPVGGAGIAIDDVFVGRPAVETLARYTFDADACGGSDPATAACAYFEESANLHLGRLTHQSSYRNGTLVSKQSHVYRGRNGRLSGVRHLVDWEGAGEVNQFVTNWNYDEFGQPFLWVAPYQPLLDQPRQYTTSYRRGLIDDILVDDASYLVGGPTTHGASYNPAGGLTALNFANGAQNSITQDVLYRPKVIDVTDAASSVLWSSGDYEYDGAGNITKIDQNQFRYDEVGRLTWASLFRQASSPSMDDPYDVVYQYDRFGNMTDRTWGHATEPQPVVGLVFQNRTHSGNRISEANFRYDANGNLMEMIGATGGPATMLWDSRNRMTTYYHGSPQSGHSVAERYAYDANGYRVVRWPESGDGQPHIYIRDGAGQVLAEFVERPADTHPVLHKDFVYGLGQLLAERRVTGTAPNLVTNSTFASAGTYGFVVASDTTYTSYMVDIRADSSFVNKIGGIIPDGNGVFWLPESAFSLGEANYVRIRGESTLAESYSPPLTLIIDPGVTPASPNQVRAFSVSRQRKDVIIRWDLLEENGQKTFVYFDRDDGGGSQLLTKKGLASGIKEFAFDDGSVAFPHGEFVAVQQSAAGPATCMPTNGNEQDMVFGRDCSEPEPDPSLGPDPYIFANAFHHRDHLGSLRVVTDAGGTKLAGHDYYPFGLELLRAGDNPPSASQLKFTGHERDEGTGLDYMRARYFGPNLARFLGVDSGNDTDLRMPKSWNLYTYVRNTPLMLVDPTGMAGDFPAAGNVEQYAAQMANRIGQGKDDDVEGTVVLTLSVTGVGVFGGATLHGGGAFDSEGGVAAVGGASFDFGPAILVDGGLQATVQEGTVEDIAGPITEVTIAAAYGGGASVTVGEEGIEGVIGPVTAGTDGESLRAGAVRGLFGYGGGVYASYGGMGTLILSEPTPDAVTSEETPNPVSDKEPTNEPR